MKRLAIAISAAIIACAAPVVSAMAEQAPQIPGLSDEARAILFNEAGEPTPGDFEWARWAWSEDAREQADWRTLMAWLEGEQARQTAEVRTAVAELVGDDFDLRHGSMCRKTVACLMIQQAPSIGKPSKALFDSAYAEAIVPYKSYRDAVETTLTISPIIYSVNSSIETILTSRAFVDQMWRKSFRPVTGELPDDVHRMLASLFAFGMIKTDIKNTAFLRSYVEEHGWPSISRVGKDASNNAWLLVQHADLNPDFQIEALRLMEPLLEAGDVRRRNYAYLYDRVQRSLDLPQRYGTQFECADGKMQPRPLEDEPAVDKLRTEMGLEPLADYAKLFPETC